MGYELTIGKCFNCHKVFPFNHRYVPSYNNNGVKEPVCGECMEKVNKVREDNDLPPHFIHHKAYTEEEVY